MFILIGMLIKSQKRRNEMLNLEEINRLTNNKIFNCEYQKKGQMNTTNYVVRVCADQEPSPSFNPDIHIRLMIMGYIEGENRYRQFLLSNIMTIEQKGQELWSWYDENKDLQHLINND